MKLDPSVQERYPGFISGYASISGVTIEPQVEGLEEEKRRVFSELKSKYGDVSVLDICYKYSNENFESSLHM
jgi:hypothetical protein